MKLLINILDESKIPFIMEFLKSQPYIKTKHVSRKKAKLIRDLREAMHEVKLHQEGKLKLQSGWELLDEL